MRTFIVKNITPLSNSEGGHYMNKTIQLIPILSEHYTLDDSIFRCIEHKKGEIKLKNDNFLLILKEIF